MTAAVCLKCGCLKIGAFTECPDCDFAPETEDDKTQALSLTDWSLDWDDLERISQELIAQNPHVKRAPPSEPSQSSFNPEDYDEDEIP